MQTLRILYHLALADFRERTRRYSFLIMLGLVIALGYAVNAGFLTLRLMPNYRGELNSAWIGSMISLAINFFLGWFGFYLVNNCIDRDIQTGVGQIIATTPLKKLAYLVGKWISNFMVLGIMVVIMAVAAVIMQLLSKESTGIDWVALLAPLFSVSLPTMGFVASLAILFESISWLRGGIGNVIYFFGYSMIFGQVLLSKVTIPFEPLGLSVYMPSLTRAAQAKFPEYLSAVTLSIAPKRALETFPWSGIDWTAEIILQRLIWIIIALLIVLLASVFFNRFDPSAEKVRNIGRYVKKVGSPDQSVSSIVADSAMSEEITNAKKQHQSRVPTWLQSPTMLLDRYSPSTRFGSIFLAELRMLLKGMPWWWWLILLSVEVAAIFSPLKNVKGGLLPAAWILPIFIWSSMGNREQRFNTANIVFSAENPVWRQLPASWLGGVFVAALAGLGGLVSLVIHLDGYGISYWISAVLFLPSIALAFGILSGSSKLFEVVYLLWWVSGPIQKAPFFDFVGNEGTPLLPLTPLFYLILSIGLFAVSIYGRQRQVRA